MAIRSEASAPLWIILVGLAAATGWLCATATTHIVYLVLICAGVLYATFAVAAMKEPILLVSVFLLVLIVLPPFFFRQTGDTPIYVSTSLVPIALALILIRWPDLKFQPDPIAKGLFLFVACTGTSLPFAWWFSGSEVAGPSVLRWLMLAQTLLVYVLIRGGMSSDPGRRENWVMPMLIFAAVISAAYGIYDFIWPVPIPHPAAAQFLYLPNGLVRRAQGVLYESSSFANLCGFFLAATAAAFVDRKETIVGLAGKWLVPCILVLAGAVVVAFSRITWANVLTTFVVYCLLTRRTRWRRTLVLLAAFALPLLLLAFYYPEAWSYFLGYRLGSLSLLFTDPNSASSGRFNTWTEIISILYRTPQYFLLGIGYKTLPYTRLFGHEIIVDNGYLSLLLETGVLGLAGFFAFLGSILKSFWKLSRSANPMVSFWSTLIFAFWCGQCVQFLAADAYTYWRNMVVFVAVMALVMNWAERDELERMRGHNFIFADDWR